MNIVTIKNLFVIHRDKNILNNINLDIPKNKITVILGPSGSGKSTLLKSINRMVEEDNNIKVSGEIKVNNKDIYLLPIQELRKKIGMVFQTPNPFPFSIYKNMTYALEYFGMKNKNELNKIVEDKLKKVSLYDEIKGNLKMNALKLSGGQKQRLCIARALTINPEILILDEPCSALDYKNTLNIEALLKQLSREYTIILVTHNIQQADRIADKKIYIENGQISNIY